MIYPYKKYVEWRKRFSKPFEEEMREKEKTSFNERKCKHIWIYKECNECNNCMKLISKNSSLLKNDDFKKILPKKDINKKQKKKI